MTTLDDAAERQLIEIASRHGLTVGQYVGDQDMAALRAAYQAATEAAAKKCDAMAKPLPESEEIESDYRRGYNYACALCAAAIRGNK